MDSARRRVSGGNVLRGLGNVLFRIEGSSTSSLLQLPVTRRRNALDSVHDLCTSIAGAPVRFEVTVGASQV